MHAINMGLVTAFPAELREHALAALDTFPEPEHPPFGMFSVKVTGQLVEIPYRLYHSPGLIVSEHLSNLETNLADCLLTRHHNGLVRQKHLKRIIHLTHSWVPPFIVQLLGEYVVEIIAVINDNLSTLDRSRYRDFLLDNQDFFDQTAQRVSSYWHCYYRDQNRQDYVGFKVLEYFRSLVK
jgi:hypothetical protein